MIKSSNKDIILVIQGVSRVSINRENEICGKDSDHAVTGSGFLLVIHSPTSLEVLQSEAYEPKSTGDGGGAGVGSMLVVRIVRGFEALRAAATSWERVR
jgi:hypothetical protein